MGGNRDGRILPIVICDGGEYGTDDTNVYKVVEVQYKYMGFYKTFKSKDEYERYEEGKVKLRQMCEEIKGMESGGKLTGEEVRMSKMGWLDQAREWSNEWGEMYTPDDIREVIDLWLRDISSKVWLWWAPFKEMETTPDILGHIDHYKIEREIA